MALFRNMIKLVRLQIVRSYSDCGCPRPGGGKGLKPQSTCKPGPMPANPCYPIHHQGKDTWKKYRMLVLLVCLPLIAAQAFNALSHAPKPKGKCRDYEYMRIRTKRFPWGDGKESLFHNPHVNHLPGECEGCEEEDCD